MGSQSMASRRPTSAAPSVDVREVLNSLRRIVRTLRLSSRSAEQAVGLSGAQLFVLQCLARSSPCSINDLAERTATDQSSVSVVVGRLVRAGHVLRAASKHDRRRVELSLTASGRAIVQRAPEAAQERLLGALGGLSKAEVAALRRLLAKVVEGAEAAEEAPSLFFEEGPVPVAKARGKRG
jgi:MarR family transcriptional regulator, lower aerobic nicotinate degradation pathway regulator